MEPDGSPERDGETQTSAATAKPPLRAIWLAWLIGAGSFGALYLIYICGPEFYLGSHLGGVLVLLFLFAHVAGCFTTLAMAMGQEFRRVPEFWLLVAYWVLVMAFWLLPTRVSSSAAMVAAAAMPVAGLVRCLCRAGPSP